MNVERVSEPFKIGDRVRYIGARPPFCVTPRAGGVGTVTAIPYGYVLAVRWDERLRYGKEPGHVWRVHVDDIENAGDAP